MVICCTCPGLFSCQRTLVSSLVCTQVLRNVFLDSRKRYLGSVLWMLGSVLASGKCSEVCFRFWDVSWILRSALDSEKCFGFWKVFLGSVACFGFWGLDSWKCFPFITDPTSLECLRQSNFSSLAYAFKISRYAPDQ